MLIWSKLVNEPAARWGWWTFCGWGVGHPVAVATAGGGGYQLFRFARAIASRRKWARVLRPDEPLPIEYQVFATKDWGTAATSGEIDRDRTHGGDQGSEVPFHTMRDTLLLGNWHHSLDRPVWPIPPIGSTEVRIPANDG